MRFARPPCFAFPNPSSYLGKYVTCRSTSCCRSILVQYTFSINNRFSFLYCFHLLRLIHTWMIIESPVSGGCVWWCFTIGSNSINSIILTPIWYEVLSPLAKATHSCNGKHLSDDGFLVAASFDEKKTYFRNVSYCSCSCKSYPAAFRNDLYWQKLSCLTFGGNEATFLAEFNENWHWRDSNQYPDFQWSIIFFWPQRSLWGRTWKNSYKT